MFSLIYCLYKKINNQYFYTSHKVFIYDLQAYKDVLNGKLVITGNDPVPVQINEGVVYKMEDMAITHEEADTMTIHQVAYVAANNVPAVADDTDIAVLL